MKVALVHDWLTGMRGGEKCLEIFCEIFPEAPIYTLLHVKGSVSPAIERHPIHTSYIQNFPFVEKKYRNYLPFMPSAIEKLDLSAYDLILSSSHCVAKGVITRSDAVHICYCHTPVRYAWDLFDQYFSGENPLKKWIIGSLISRLRKWDYATRNRVDHYIANSANIAGKIKKYYEREATVIHPPVDTDQFPPASPSPTQTYLMVSAFAPYKRLDIAIEAFNELGYPLRIIGKGQTEAELKKLAKPNIEFLGWIPTKELKKHFSDCLALIFPGEEDFGIVPVEAQAAGRPVIAFGKGGILETVIPLDENGQEGKSPTGVFFPNQRAEDLVRAIRYFESKKELFDPGAIQKHASLFHQSLFRERIKNFIKEKVPSLPFCG